MIYSFIAIEELFRQIDEHLHKRVDIYIIGGAALLRRGIKGATKDIDLVVSTKQEFIEMQNALIKIGFDTQYPEKEYSRLNLAQIYHRRDFRIDLFEKEVCGRFSLSETMKQRGERIISLKHINVFLCSNEDILLFKTMTERDGDIADSISIASSEAPNWNIFFEELQSQIKNSKQDVWITWVGERLDILVNKGVDIPIMDKVDELREKFFEDFEKRPSYNGKE